MKSWKRCHGLLAATLTPMHADGSINYDMIEPYIDHLVANKVTKIFLNGSAAEHNLLSVEERKKLAEKFVTAGKGKLDLIVIQCGTENLVNTRELAAHAQSIGADAVAAIAPTYFKPQNTESLVAYMSEVAKACPDTPFMYYHFPGLTGIPVRLCDFFKAAHGRIPNLIGGKFTSPDFFDAGLALQTENFKYDVVIGAETMLVGAMAMGIDSAIGIAFSILGKPCDRIFRNVHAGKFEEARNDQYMVQQFWNLTHQAGNMNQCVASFKACMSMAFGLDFGPPRLPIQDYTAERKAEIKKQLTDMGFFDWLKKD